MIPVGAETAFQGAYVHPHPVGFLRRRRPSSYGDDHAAALRRVPVPAPSGV